MKGKDICRRRPNKASAVVLDAHDLPSVTLPPCICLTIAQWFEFLIQSSQWCKRCVCLFVCLDVWCDAFVRVPWHSLYWRQTKTGDDKNISVI